MKKSEFGKIRESYYKRRKKLESINVGCLVWEDVPRGLDFDYHPAIVKKVNVDEDYIDVIDISWRDEEKRLTSFLTESEMIEIKGMTKQIIKREYENYAEIIKEIKESRR